MTAPIESYTNTSLATARRCPREFYLRYGMQLERDGEDSDALQVGQTWHKAFDVAHAGGDPYAAIATHAPSLLWAEKLRRLYAAYHWYWASQKIEQLEAEKVFEVQTNMGTFRGSMDGTVRLADGRVGLIERKTTADDLAAESEYWSKLRMDVQVGIYALALDTLPAFILYDVVRKPTIRPKGITKKDAERLRSEIGKTGEGKYYETFPAEVIEEALRDEHETVALYGARLSADIGERPEHYFARREVPRTASDYAALADDLSGQISTIERRKLATDWSRNPDACNTFGTCDFFALCSNNIHPLHTDATPQGYRVREHLHPELQAQSASHSVGTIPAT